MSASASTLVSKIKWVLDRSQSVNVDARCEQGFKIEWIGCVKLIRFDLSDVTKNSCDQFIWFNWLDVITRKHSSRMHTDRIATRPSSEPVSMRLIVDRQTLVKTLPSLAVRKKSLSLIVVVTYYRTTQNIGVIYSGGYLRKQSGTVNKQQKSFHIFLYLWSHVQLVF